MNHNTPTTRLWTLQSAAILRSLNAGKVYRADWKLAPANFLIAYEWMARQLAVVVSDFGESAPVWCWHSCNGVANAPPSVGTATSLFGTQDLTQGFVAIEMDVPSGSVLLSSYWGWNLFLDLSISKQRVPRSQLCNRLMFEPPLLKHRHDDVQAVIPEINPLWIRRVGPLVIDGREWEEPILAVE